MSIALGSTTDGNLRHSRELLTGLLEATSGLSVIAVDSDGLITLFNSGAERMLGYPAAEMIGSNAERLHDPNEIRCCAMDLGVARDFEAVLASSSREGPDGRQWTYVRSDHRRLPVTVTVTALRTPQGMVDGYLMIAAASSERLHTQAAVSESEARFRDTFRYAPNGMMLIGLDPEDPGRFLDVNPALCALTGHSRAALLGMRANDLTHPEHAGVVADRLTALADDQQLGSTVERHWIHADGHDLWVQASVGPRQVGPPAYVIAQVEDITARRQAEAGLKQQALHDWLTGLPNRLLLMDRLQHALAATRSQRQVAVMYLDLDGFKAVNDTAGHAAGDQLLVATAERLRGIVRPGDTVARLGGDEFVIVCPDVTTETVTSIATRTLEALQPRHIVAGYTFTVTASIGISLSANSSDAQQLLHEADDAMYTAKYAGKNGLQLGGRHDPTSAARAVQADRAVRVAAELRNAVECDELVLYGQPIYRLSTGEILAVEGLLRWQHPVRGVLGPKEFLDIAEAGDLMAPIGRRVLDESCRMAATWFQTLGAIAPPVHVNISARQLETGDLRSDVLAALDRHALPASQLVLELTETQMPEYAESMRHDLRHLRARGIALAIDDLGTGYSSLARLTELPVDILKIDLSFVARMADDPASAAVVRSILSIGQALHLTVVAEGVETAEQARQLSDYGCDAVQGFWYSRALPEPALLELLCDAYATR